MKQVGQTFSAMLRDYETGTYSPKTGTIVKVTYLKPEHLIVITVEYTEKVKYYNFYEVGDKWHLQWESSEGCQLSWAPTFYRSAKIPNEES